MNKKTIDPIKSFKTIYLIQLFISLMRKVDKGQEPVILFIMKWGWSNFFPIATLKIFR